MSRNRSALIIELIFAALIIGYLGAKTSQSAETRQVNSSEIHTEKGGKQTIAEEESKDSLTALVLTTIFFPLKTAIQIADMILVLGIGLTAYLVIYDTWLSSIGLVHDTCLV